VASIANDKNGTRRILFVDPHGARKSIYLGKIDKKTAESIARHVEHVVNSKMTGGTLPRESAAWLANIGEVLREKLTNAGLVESMKRSKLQDFLKDIVLGREDVKPATIEIMSQPCRNLTEYFGADKDLRSITAGDAEQFAQWLRTQGLAMATLAKRLGFARQFFNSAKKHKLIDENPFSEVKIPTADVTTRQQFVDRPTIAKLLEVANPTWKTIIALSRFGGLRCPSEVLSLEWKHVNWEKSELTVISPKTERYDGKGSRVAPIFSEVRKYLEEAYAQREEGQTHVVGGNHLQKANGPTGWKNCNLRTSFEKLIRRAGVEPWPRLFHNLRSSRETELIEQFPPQAVAKWLGHDVAVCLKHYAQVTDEHFQRAIGMMSQKDSAESSAPTAQIPAQSGSVIQGNDGNQNYEVLGKAVFSTDDCHDLPNNAQLYSGRAGIRTLG
jgi:integrase